MKKHCVYVHICPNGKKYVGQTSQKPENRWRDGRGYEESPFFFKAIKKYGWDNIEHIILNDNLTKERAIYLEKTYIQIFRTQDSRFGYNLTPGGEVLMGKDNPNYGHHWSDELRAQQSERRKGKKASEETKKKMSLQRKGSNNSQAKKVNQYDENGRFIKTWECQNDAAEFVRQDNKRDGSEIFYCCRTRKGSYLGFFWRYYEDYPNTDDLECVRKPRRKKAVAQYDLSGELIREFPSLRSACKNVYNNENFKEGIKACCEEKTLNYRGYIWKYVDKEN